MSSKKYLQIAFNHSFNEYLEVIRLIPNDPKIIIEAGTPLIKSEGIGVVRKMRAYWSGLICADMKIVDGAKAEVQMAKAMGADYVTAVGNSSADTLKIFVDTCKEIGIKSVIDSINTVNPLKVLWKANAVPDVVLIHRGRDEENSFGSVIQYKDIAKIKGKYDILVGAGGGIDYKGLESATFNGADIVVVNVVRPNDPWSGLVIDSDLRNHVKDFTNFVK